MKWPRWIFGLDIVKMILFLLLMIITLVLFRQAVDEYHEKENQKLEQEAINE